MPSKIKVKNIQKYFVELNTKPSFLFSAKCNRFRKKCVQPTEIIKHECTLGALMHIINSIALKWQHLENIPT